MRFLFSASLLGMLACGSLAEDYIPTDDDDSRRVFQKAQTLNYDLSATQPAIDAYEYLLNRFSFGVENDAIEDIVWSHYDLGLIYFREREKEQAIFHLNQTMELGQQASTQFQLITNPVDRERRRIRVDNAVLLANTLLEKLKLGHERHRATYATGDEDQEREP